MQTSARERGTWIVVPLCMFFTGQRAANIVLHPQMVVSLCSAYQQRCHLR